MAPRPARSAAAGDTPTGHACGAKVEPFSANLRDAQGVSAVAARASYASLATLREGEGAAAAVLHAPTDWSGIADF